MDKKVIVVSSGSSNLTESIAYKLEQDRIDYEILSSINKIDNKNKPSSIVLVNNLEYQSILDYASKNKINLLVISSHKLDLNNCLSPKNTIITGLVNDKEVYSHTQKEFLFRKGIYSVVNNYVNHFVSDSAPVDGLIIDMTEIELSPHDWIFEFSSLNESYSWLTRHNGLQDPNIELRDLNFFLDRLYDDSDKEIRYLVDRIKAVRNGQKATDTFICTKEELNKYKNNLFFRNLVKNTSKNYKVFIVDKDKLAKSYPDIIEKILYGIIVYDDCVYRDYLDNETSLGYVDCRPEVVDDYRKTYDFLIKTLGVEIKKEEDINGF